MKGSGHGNTSEGPEENHGKRNGKISHTGTNEKIILKCIVIDNVHTLYALNFVRIL